ncbi:MAG: hypothetical protein M1816_004722 [Peltula sp. TS41687]|nr:MAG: hypothetical protein M1816_004722 [Peltula sp. TS41687]
MTSGEYLRIWETLKCESTIAMSKVTGIESLVKPQAQEKAELGDSQRWLEEAWSEDMHGGTLSRDALHKRWFGSDIIDWLEGLINGVSGGPKISNTSDERALEGREKALGKKHPHTLTSVNNLTVVMQYQGKYEAAEEMNRRALEGRERALGKEHPHTLKSVSNLASVLQHQGKYEAAWELRQRALKGRVGGSTA